MGFMAQQAWREQNFGYAISCEKIKPLIKTSQQAPTWRIDRRRHLIVETPKGFIQFRVSMYKELRGPYLYRMSYEILPKMKDRKFSKMDAKK